MNFESKYPKAVSYLRDIFRNIPSGKNPFSNFNEMLEYYTTDQHLLKFGERVIFDDRLQAIEEILKYLDRNERQNAISRLSASFQKNSIPDGRSLVSALENSFQQFSFNDFSKAVSDGIGDTVNAVSGTLKSGILLYAMGAILGLFILTKIRK